MAPAFSKLTPIPFNCYELGHTWTPHCAQAASDLAASCFKESLRIYTGVYVFSLIASRRVPKSKEDIFNLLKDIIRSSTFLTTNAVGFITFFCLFRRLTGHFNFWSLGFLPTLCAAYVAIQIEKPKRRAMLALYVTNVAVDLLFRMLRARGIVGNVKHFDLGLFLVSILTILYHKKKGNGRRDIIDAVLTKIIGAEEFAERQIPETAEVPPEERIFNPEVVPAPGGVPPAGDEAEALPPLDINAVNHPLRGRALARTARLPQSDTFRNRFVHFVLWMHKSAEDIACHLERMINAVNEGQRHELCQHTDPCLEYWLRGFWTRFMSGFGIQGVIQSVLFIKSLLTARKKRMSPPPFNNMLHSCVKSGLGLSSMCFGFRLFSCSFRWLQGTDVPVNAIASSLMPTILTFFLLKPPPTVSLYVFFKAAEIVISQSHNENNWRLIRWLDSLYGGGWAVLYAFSTALLFHAGMLEPHNLKNSYQGFLAKITGGKLYQINRHMFTLYGTESDVIVKNFWPNFKPKYTTQLMKQVIQERESLGRGNEVLREITRRIITGI